MASRLYGPTRLLYLHVENILRRLGLPSLGTPTLNALIALQVTGLLLLDAPDADTPQALPARPLSDALNRLLRIMPLSTRAVMQMLLAFARRLGREGYLCLGDVIVEKAYAKRLPWAGWTYSFAKKRKLDGLHIVVLLWCSLDGHWRIPVGFRLWPPRRSCGAARYRTKLEVASELVTTVVAAWLPVSSIVFDTHYTASWFTKRMTRLGLRAVRLRVVAPKQGELQLVVVRNGQGNWEYLVSNDHEADLTTLVLRKRSRWSVETVFRDTKQFASLEACQSWVEQALVQHVALVLVTFVVVQLLRTRLDEPMATVKERWQLMVLSDGAPPPEPLRACPIELRSTA